MATRTLFNFLRDRFRKFERAEGGNIMMTFALATVPIMGFVGSAIDYSRANAAKAAMQAAADATALMMSKSISNLNSGQITTEAGNYFNALLTNNQVTGVTVTPTYTTTGGTQVVLSATASMPTTFMKVLGMSSLNIDVSSTVKWGDKRLRVALVLDNTGSMSSAGKMTALKTAAKNLLSQLQAAVSQNGDVYVSIIPFVKDVNVDPINYNQSWIDWTDWDANNGTCKGYSGKKQPQDKSSCLSAGGKWTPDNHNTWNGCITDRGNSSGPSTLNTDTNVTPAVAGNIPTLFPADQYSYCPATVMPLSYNWSAMNTAVDNMSPNGSTNQNIGLVHGWQSLVGGGPFPAPPALDPNYTYQQVIILLTDGLNTQDRWYGNGSSTSPQIDARQQITCDNVKAAGITIYTVQVNTDGDPTSTLLQNCASSPDKFFLLTSANAIVATFRQIGTALSSLRVAK